MINTARLLAHKSINSVYQSRMQPDQMEALGHQMTRSIGSFITNSANSASVLHTERKGTVNALNVSVDNSNNAFGDPKFEIIVELSSCFTAAQMAQSVWYNSRSSRMLHVLDSVHSYTKDCNQYPKSSMSTSSILRVPAQQTSDPPDAVAPMPSSMGGAE
ncbi:hypothetical protein AAF712_009717 [Marasmius tenuissimus]|uniref:Uncharacterized protein n=1 Tax=Marasmius tenuissimus TaxID=585030 RepID=A0ABR2ZH80_9AGAR